MKYVKYFLNKTLAEGFKAESDFVAYLDEENKVLYSRGGEMIKDGEMVADAPDPTEGFVDLGLSVMWASCNLGASSPEETGLFYSWGEVNGHELAEDGVSFKDGHRFSPYYENNEYTGVTSDDLQYGSKDTVKQYYISQGRDMLLHYRMPNNEQWQELIDGTTRELITINDKQAVKLTSKNNGNFIVLPLSVSFSPNGTSSNHVMDSETACYWSSTSGDYSGAYSEIYHNSGNIYLRSSSNSQDNYSGFQIRGVCSLLPTTAYVSPGKKITNQDSYAVYSNNMLFCASSPTTIFASNTPDFEPVNSDPNVICMWEMYNRNGEYEINLSEADLNFGSPHNLKYLKFVSENGVDVTVSTWVPVDPLVTKTLLLKSPYVIFKNTPTSTVFRLHYCDLIDKNLQLEWTGYSKKEFYIASVYNFMSSSVDANVLFTGSINGRKIRTISNSDIALWEPELNEEGIVYIKFNSGNSTLYVTLLPNE